MVNAYVYTYACTQSSWQTSVESGRYYQNLPELAIALSQLATVYHDLP